jgi:hypothetical protein
MGHTYEIETAADFVKVPADRMDECLKDFVQWVEFARVMNELGTALGKEVGVDEVFSGQRFVWTDNGKPGISGVRITVKETGEDFLNVKVKKP